MTENIFISRESNVSFGDALSNVISSNGIRLIVATGFIGKTNHVSEIYRKLKNALANNRNLKIELYIGVHKSSTATEDQIIAIHMKHLPTDLLSIDEASRITIYGIKDLHSKFALMLNEDSIGVCATMGSSNLSEPALCPTTRIELDLFMQGGAENVLLQKFTKEAMMMIENSVRQESTLVRENIRDRIYSVPLDIILERMAEIEASFEKMEHYQSIIEAREQEIKYHHDVND